MKKMSVFVVVMGIFGAACASVGAAPSRRFDKRLYARAHEAELAKLDPQLSACAGDQGPITVTWKVAGDGHIEDVVVTDPKAPSEKLDACVRAHAYSAQFTAPANHQRVLVSRNVGRTFAAVY
jgi:outer membrane biosynthesis protein TonB